MRVFSGKKLFVYMQVLILRHT